VLLLEPAPTPYDLRWRMFGTPVRVHPMFWLLTVLLGWRYVADPGFGIGYLALWVAVVFVSILLHEFGHVLTGRVFGADSRVVLYTFGGLAIGSLDLRRRWQRVLVSVAGPAAQLLLAAAVWWGFLPLVRLPQHARWKGPVAETIVMLLEINIFWPLLNLLPIWPLDGGKVIREVCAAIFGRMGVSVSLGISVFVAGLLALDTYMALQDRPLIPYNIPRGGPYLFILYLLLCWSSFGALREENQRLRWQGSDDWRWRG
jgi:stage IV sporulation protein FB